MYKRSKERQVQTLSEEKQWRVAVQAPCCPSSGDKGEGGLVKLESGPEEGYVLV